MLAEFDREAAAAIAATAADALREDTVAATPAVEINVLLRLSSVTSAPLPAMPPKPPTEIATFGFAPVDTPSRPLNPPAPPPPPTLSANTACAPSPVVIT